MSDRAPISRDDAYRIATQYLQSLTGQPKARPIREVLPADQVRLSLYGVSAPVERLWVAYVATPLIGLVSSTVVLVSKDTGEVLYYGSANDEG